MRLKKDPVLYREATKSILAQIDALQMTPEKRKRAIHLVQLFRESFTNTETRKATFLANSKENIWNDGYDSGGFCRVSSIAFMVAMDWHEWDLMAIDRTEWISNHHWLVHKQTGKVLDLTYDQFLTPVPYNAGHKESTGAFLNDETAVFAKSVGLDLKQLLVETKGK